MTEKKTIKGKYSKRELSNIILPNLIGSNITKEIILLQFLCNKLNILLITNENTNKMLLRDLEIFFKYLKENNSSLLRNHNVKLIRDIKDDKVNANLNNIAFAISDKEQFVYLDPWNKQIDIPMKEFSKFDMVFYIKEYKNEKGIKQKDTQKSSIDEYKFLQTFLEHADNFEPKMSLGAKRKLLTFFSGFKFSDKDSFTIKINIKQFETIEKLANAYAKIEFSKVINKNHMQKAIDRLLFNLEKAALDPTTGNIDISRVEHTYDDLDVLKLIVKNLRNPKAITIDYFNSLCQDEGYDSNKVERMIQNLIEKEMIYKIPECYGLYETNKLDELEHEVYLLKNSRERKIIREHPEFFKRTVY